MQNTIYQRIYKNQGRITSQGKAINEKVPVGMVMARKTDDNMIEFGYSAVHPADKYSDKEAFRYVYASMQVSPTDIPTRVRKVFPKFVNRAKRYFKDCRFGL